MVLVKNMISLRPVPLVFAHSAPKRAAFRATKLASHASLHSKSMSEFGERMRKERDRKCSDLQKSVKLFVTIGREDIDAAVELHREIVNNITKEMKEKSYDVMVVDDLDEDDFM